MDNRHKIFLILKVLIFIIIVIAIFISLGKVSLLLNDTFSSFIKDKKSIIEIDEGEYILIKMAKDYEKVLQNKKEQLQAEQERLLIERGKALSKKEKKVIENKLKLIRSQNNSLSDELEKHDKEKKQFEVSLKTTQSELKISKEKIAKLKNNEIQLKYDKEQAEKNLDKYKKEIAEKNSEIERLKNDSKDKLVDIESSYDSVDDDTKEVIKNLNEELEQYKTKYSKLQTSYNDIKKSEKYYKELYSTNSSNVSEIDKIQAANKETEKLLKNVASLKKNKNYSDALDLCHKIIMDYPYSEDIETVLDESKSIIELIKQDEIDAVTDDLNILKDKYSKLQNDLKKTENKDVSDNYQEQVEIADKKTTKNLENIKKLKKKKEYDKALDLCHETVIKYSVSKYITNVIDEAKLIIDLLIETNVKQADEELSSIKDKYSSLQKELEKVKENYQNNLKAYTENLSDKEIIKSDNEKTLKSLEEVVSLKSNEEYENALNLCHSIITDYPDSEYLNKVLDEIRSIIDLIKKREIENVNNSIKLKFEPDYDKFNDYYENDEIELARKYYFKALIKAFDEYSNNSINDFKIFEDIYIDMLLKNLEDELKIKYSN